MNINYSVVATTYNDEDSVETFIKEITNQTFPPKEIVIADGGSSDKTVEKLMEISKSSSVPIRIISGKRLNIAEGYNEALKEALSEFVGITGVGNHYSGDFFECLAGRITEKNLDGAYSPVRGFDTTDFSKIYNNQILNGEYGQRLQIASNHGVLLKKTVFEKLDYFYEKFIYAGEDTEFYLLAEHSGYKFELVEGAQVYWETPKNFKDFKRQTRVYSIAGLQISPYNQLGMIITESAVIVLCIAVFTAFIASTIRALVKLSVLLVLAFGVILLHKKIKPLRLLQIWFQIYYTFANLKYAKIEYRVRR